MSKRTIAYGGCWLQRKEAVSYLKEVLNSCPMSPDAVTLEEAQQQKGYNIHIKGTIDENDKQIVQDVAKRRSLAVREDKDQVIIYKPFFTPPPPKDC